MIVQNKKKEGKSQAGSSSGSIPQILAVKGKNKSKLTLKVM